MSNKVKINSRTPFASVPNEFLQNKNISIEAKGTGSFLQSLPAGWEILPWWIQRELGYKKKKWNSIANELIKYGCLKLIKGGSVKGSHYEFSFYEYNTNLFNSRTNDSLQTLTDSRECQKGTVAFRDCPKKAPHIKKQKLNKETGSKINKQTENVVVLLDELVLIGFTKASANRLIIKYDCKDILSKMDLLKIKDSKVKNKMAWLCAALRDDYKYSNKLSLPEHKVVEIDSQKRIKEIDDRNSKPKDYSAAKKHLDILRRGTTKNRSMESSVLNIGDIKL